MKKLTGHCLCGAIEYKITSTLGPIVNCHCYQCRRWHGTAFRTRASVKKENFSWVKGKEHLSEYQSSKHNIKTFCSICGSNLISLSESNPDYIGLPLGGLKEDPGSRPLANIFVSSKAPWYEISDGLPQYDDEPPEGSGF